MARLPKVKASYIRVWVNGNYKIKKGDGVIIRTTSTMRLVLDKCSLLIVDEKGVPRANGIAMENLKPGAESAVVAAGENKFEVWNYG